MSDLSNESISKTTIHLLENNNRTTMGVNI